ncbi:helicase-related protein [Microvirga massiliensis]|uniref:helicase-related protein n=1 Tax=Microvirga massiliensis TaxID=1033741 RepID=UPI00062B4F71|nr:helicase-related protein [Microvirga massiliensis]
MARRSLLPQLRARGVTAILGPTNTGKTHFAIERMLGHESGMIGLPLRLLAREVYQRVVEKAGAANVALITGEEKIKPDRPRYWISTVEAMPRDLDLAFVAVDEIQLASDLDRGHVFTDRLLNQRGREETLLIGSATMRHLVEALIPGVHIVTRPRLSKLTFAGEKKISRLPHRTAIVAFSAEEVYAIAELIRRHRGGAAVVLGALSPRTRNAQVELYQSGDVDYLVATDAIGMGLNLDVDHVAFASDKKFDGFRFRKLYPPELGQIAGRAGRFMRDGTFGTTGRCPPFDNETVQALENHFFDPARVIQWRNPDLDFSSLSSLRAGLAAPPVEHGLLRAPMGEDVAALEVVSREDDIGRLARSRGSVERLWQVCQVPDYRKVSPQTHADLVGQLYRFIMREGAIPADWFARHISMVDRTDGDIDTLSNRIAQVRTWSFVANRPDWLKDPEHWQGVARQVEDKLSDALHERLAQRFVDRRTSVLMRRLRENAMLEAEITAAGDVTVEGQHVGHLHGFHFVPDPQAETAEAKTLRNAAGKALSGEIEARADRFESAPDATIVLSNDGTIRWLGDPVAKLEPGDKVFEPRFRILADEQLTGAARDKVENRLRAWLKAYVTRLLGPAMQLEVLPELTGIARGIGYQIAEALGVLERSKVLTEVRGLDQEGRAALRRAGVRFGAYHLYLPALLKPAPRTLAAQLWALQNGGLDQKGIDEIAHLAGSGRTSIPVDSSIAPGLYRAAGFRVCGARAVRVDILERLADLIRPAIAYRPGTTPGDPPAGAADGDGFVSTVAMTSLVGCSGDDFASILKSLGYVMETRQGPAITVPLVPAAASVPVTPANGPAAASPDNVAAEPSGSEEAGDAPVAEDVAPADEAITQEAPEDDRPADHPAAAAGEPEAVSAVEEPADEVEAVGVSDATAEAGTERTEEADTAAPVEASPAEGAAPTEGEASAETASAESEEIRAEGAVDAAATPEPTMIEVWHIGRRHHERRPNRNRGKGRGSDQAGERQERRPHPRGERPDRRDRPQRPDLAARDGASGPAGEGRPARPQRPGRHDERRGPWPDQRHEHRGDQRRERPDHRREERRDRAPDPNSPFAKLLALKAQLEDKGNR